MRRSLPTSHGGICCPRCWRASGRRRRSRVLLKLNVVPIAEQDETLLELAALAREYTIHVRFIEMMPIGFGRKYRSRSEAELVELLGQRFGP